MQCSQITKSGKQCSRKATDQYCWQHHKSHNEEKEDPILANIKFLITDKLKNLKIPIADEVINIINYMFTELFKLFSTSDLQKLEILINDLYIGNLKKSALNILRIDTNIPYSLISDLIHKLVSVLKAYIQINNLKIFTFKDLNYAIYKSSELYSVLNFGLIPEKYLQLSSTDLLILPISYVLKEVQTYKISIDNDGLYFIRQYIVANYKNLSNIDKEECHFSENIIQFFYQWFNLIKSKLIGKLGYKSTADIILCYDIFHECQEKRRNAYQDLLIKEIIRDVENNILQDYIY